MFQLMNEVNRLLVDRSDEEGKLLRLLKSIPKDSKIVEVGCGFGRNIRLLQSNGFKNVVGVEINPKIVEHNNSSGISCLEPETFFNNHSKECFDLVLMSHIVEHFDYKELKLFLESYINILKVGGRLIVITPILTKFFYQDFDHVKPYDPTGFRMLFSEESQMQFQSGQKLRLENLYFRKSPFRLKNFRSLYVKKGTIPMIGRIPTLVNLFFSVLFKVTRGMVGYTSGWLGEFRRY